MIEIMN